MKHTPEPLFIVTELLLDNVACGHAAALSSACNRLKGRAVMARFKVQADDARYTETFTSYAEAFTWLNMCRTTFGCNAGIVEVRA